MNTSRKTIGSALLIASLGLTAAGALAQEAGTASSMAQDKMGGMQEGMEGKMGMHGRHDMLGSHAMPATVTSVDKTTGIVEATSEGMSLRVHFPPAALANLNNGDKITLHLAFSKSQ